jgi:hypothetical protein
MLSLIVSRPVDRVMMIVQLVGDTPVGHTGGAIGVAVTPTGIVPPSTVPPDAAGAVGVLAVFGVVGVVAASASAPTPTAVPTPTPRAAAAVTKKERFISALNTSHRR